IVQKGIRLWVELRTFAPFAALGFPVNPQEAILVCLHHFGANFIESLTQRFGDWSWGNRLRQGVAEFCPLQELRFRDFHPCTCFPPSRRAAPMSAGAEGPSERPGVRELPYSACIIIAISRQY